MKFKTSNYARGRDKEYRLKKKFEKAGYTVLRMASSHGFADLVAIKPDRKEIRFIQCKLHARPSQTAKLREENKIYEGWFDCSFEVW